jgi:prepilin-type N-terminal cleavage/methylation domain-containing protein
MIKRGMTLLELLIVMLLIAGIAGVFYPNISKILRNNEKGVYEQRKMEIIKAAEYRSAIRGEIYVLITNGVGMDVLGIDEYIDLDIEGDITFIIPLSYEK